MTCIIRARQRLSHYFNREILTINDLAVGFLTLGSLTALIFLFKTGQKALNDYDQQLKAGVKPPVFNTSELHGVNLNPTSERY
ncbi:alanine:cation symporter family protein [Pleionea mediterranea]|uniref:Uncharacterized protein n=1 Tax=Pleionea mediterranea TaxID=523701 RepID=A0A316FD74_9GAMM|nr:alanine:cation symporter family protein [Pleionea mediterranea]PWK45416.1 hypothetical protein C8D97_11489 [Pleionea mediterranea]